MIDFRTTVLKTIQEYKMISPRDLVIAGVSGGPDSLTMLHLLKDLQTELGFRLHVAHVDHSFRGQQAEAEAHWVEETAGRWGLASTVIKVNVAKIAKEKGISAQEAGHLVRKNFFLELMEKLGAQKIALGHQADDQAETLLMHLLVGAGLEGLQGITPKNGVIIRPLIFIRREDIETYCQEYNLEPRRDPSNKKNVYLRNKIRNQVIPWLEEKVNPNLVATLNKTAQIIQGEENLLEEATEKFAEKFMWTEKNCIYLSLRGWDSLQVGMQRRLIRFAYQSLGENQGLPFLNVEETRYFAEGGQVGKTLQLPGKILAEKGYGEIVFYHEGSIAPAVGGIEERLLKIPGVTFIPETGQQIITEIVAVDSLPENGIEKGAKKDLGKDTITVYLPWQDFSPQYYIRSRRPGDRFSPAGLQGTKKLKDYFIEKKIPRRERDSILLVAIKNSIICIPGLAIAKGWEPDSKSKKRLVLTISGTNK